MSERLTEHLLLNEMGIKFGKNNFCYVYEQECVKKTFWYNFAKTHVVN